MVHALKRKECGLLLAGVAVLGLSGCADSSRLDDPLGNPFKSSASRYDRAPTGTTLPPAGASSAAPQAEEGGFFSETFRTFDESGQSGDPVDSRRSRAPRAASSRPAPLPMPSRSLSAPAPISSQPLPPPGQAASAPAYSSRPVAPPQAAAPAPSPRAVAARVGGWTVEGGVPVVVAQGESAKAIANRYGVPTDTLLQLNGYSSAAQVQPGSRLTIPVYNANHRAEAAGAPAPRVARAEPPRPVEPAMAAPAPTRAEPAPTRGEPRMVMQPGPKSLVQEENEQVAAPAKPRLDPAADRKAQLAEARAAAMREAASSIEKRKAQDAQTAAEAGKTAAADVGKTGAAAKLAAAADAKKTADAARAEKLAQKAQAKLQQQAAAQPVAKLAEAAPAPVPAQVPVAAASKQPTAAPEEDAVARTTPATDGSNPEFRWPARGRVITGYTSGGNDGINIAVPEGTAVKAAESGVVTYAGSELKGYGNLVLIHHPNGFDSVYANNGSINVKRGDTVKRGQTIALSGQSGNVSSPQLHFELRKGHKPVDPTGFLAGL
ncbi:murein DD-endopeptidase MepM/ murein hydrolase activator NlpD [Rhodoblastus acidophilus]|uniref:peptidoglycan DD-metalloendopeptidase family protein n=1 Tax=Rhodoblastus acidophilus TaxID=1074 RepID=UPI0022255726|nr:peptidoglycan DD-metalloendopeptidase family protein [Rhodoblastus acidophilus]MCW2316957.1 murein DD-endopeptidase MepM/ murein hydrolase activator NlpD [Rhodoblastus acidophilus]